MIISVNKMVEKGAKRIKGYLRLRGVIQIQQFRGAGFLFPLGGLLGGFPGGFLSSPGLLSSLMIILSFPKVGLSVQRLLRIELVRYLNDEVKISKFRDSHLVAG